MQIDVIVYFNNGTTIKRKVDLLQAIFLDKRSTAIVPPEADLVEVRGISDSYIVPTILMFVISKTFIPSTPRPTKRNIYDRDNGKCGYCGKNLSYRDSTVDHILPESRGGQDSWRNLVTACRKCNQKKDNRTPREAGMLLYRN